MGNCFCFVGIITNTHGLGFAIYIWSYIALLDNHYTSKPFSSSVELVSSFQTTKTHNMCVLDRHNISYELYNHYNIINKL